jgi:hypothetical protein
MIWVDFYINPLGASVYYFLIQKLSLSCLDLSSHLGLLSIILIFISFYKAIGGSRVGAFF